MRTLTKQIPLVDLGRQYAHIQPEVDHAIHRVLDGQRFILGPEVLAFEAEFASFCEVEHAIGVSSGTQAVGVALKALGVGPGDEVVTAVNTFIGTTEPIHHVGARAVLCDVDPKTFNLDPEKLEATITPKTRAVIAVHLYGHPANLEAIREITRPKGIHLIEDAAQAHGARLHNRRVGSWGDLACFSFFPGKNLGAYGDAGAIVCRDQELADRVRLLRNHGRQKKYEHEVEGFNSRLDELQAAVLRVKLRHLERWNDLRRRHAASYSERLKGVPIITPTVAPGAESVFHLYVVGTDRRDDLQAVLSENGISTGIHYPIPLHLQPAYRYLGYERGAFPESERLSETILSLPIFPELADDEIERVTEIIGSYFDGVRP